MDLTADEVVRRAHAAYVRLNEELELAREREAVAQANLAVAQRHADSAVAPALPRAHRVVEAMLEEAEAEAAAVLAAAEARAHELSTEARLVFRQVVSDVRLALDDAWRAEEAAPGGARRAGPRAAPPPTPAAEAPAERSLEADDDWFAALWEGGAVNDPAAVPSTAWVSPTAGTCPAGHPVKAKSSSGLYHLPGMFAYERTAPDRCYPDEQAAQADGFRKARR